MRNNLADCTCGHTRRGHYGGSGKLADAGTCKTAHCACRQYRAKAMAVAEPDDARYEQSQQH